MARMIPDVNPLTIENEGERCFYTIAMQLPADYTVLHSYKYGEEHGEDRQPDIIREIDFIVVHPAMGFVTIEVKQGDVMYLDGAFHELKDRGRYQPMKKDPLKQASDAMYGFPGLVYAVCVSPGGLVRVCKRKDHQFMAGSLC